MNACNTVKEIRAEERERVHAEEREKFKKRICDFVAKGHLAPEHAAECLKISVEQLQEIMTEYKNHETERV